jgi:hypothetical protein
MSSSRWISLFAAGLLALTACSDATAPKSGLTPTSVIPPVSTTLSGVVSATGRDPLHGLVLMMDDGSQVALSLSAETAALASLAGAGVDVRGRFDAESFDVETFIVRQIGGAPVLDGVLLEERTTDFGDSTTVAYELQLSDGTAALILVPAPEMFQHIGARMWVRLDETGEAREFGIIESR